MPRQKKDGVNINYFIRRDVKEKLDTYCEDVGQTATMAIERILESIWRTKKAPQKAAIRLIQRDKTRPTVFITVGFLLQEFPCFIYDLLDFVQVYGIACWVVVEPVYGSRMMPSTASTA